jgi:hypothetical protein
VFVGLIVFALNSLGYFYNLAASGAAEPAATSTGNTEVTVSEPLDGLGFRGAIGANGQAKDIQDLFICENGNFVSKECELRCQYPARPYVVRQNGNRIEFISETRCPCKDATIVWRGIVAGDRLTGPSTWNVKRWYWTVEISFEFEGRLVEAPPANTSTE